MQVAIIGAGFSGLGLAYSLFKRHPGCKITLYDDKDTGGQASQMSTGLLHKYVGLKSKLNPFGKESEEEAKKRIEEVEAFTGTALKLSHGILRIAMTEEQSLYYREAARLYPDVEWLTEEQTAKLHLSFIGRPSILIHSGVTLDVAGYLQGLTALLNSQGLHRIKKTVHRLDELKSFDLVFFATGAFQPSFLPPLPMHPVKGQLIELAWPEAIPPLPYSIMGQVYMTMSKDKKSAVIGATYEHTFQHALPDPDFALKELLPKALALLPALKGSTLLDVRAGVRASTPDRLPFAGKLKDNLYALVGMGSRGLLYHAHFADRLIRSIF